MSLVEDSYPLLVEAPLPLDAEAGDCAEYKAAEQSLVPLEEPGPVQQRIPDPHGDVIVGIVGTRVMNVAVLF